MAVRLKTQWYSDEVERSFEDTGGALAFNAWRIAVDRAINLHGEHFVYGGDTQRLWVIAEYLYFMVQVVDRMAHEMLEPEQRRSLITAMALKLADHFQDNAREMLGAAGLEFGREFVERLNLRSGEYAEFLLTKDGPSYPFLRHLGSEIQRIMGVVDDNRWVIDQVMDKDGPEIHKQIKRLVRGLLS